MKIIDLKIDDVIPYDNNPRNNAETVGPLVASILEFGFTDPIIVDKNNVVICGHTRLLAAKKIGMQTVPCLIVSNLSDAEVKAYRIADNKTSENSTWNYAVLKQEILALESNGYDNSVLSFSQDFMDDLLNTDEYNDIIEDGETDPDYLPDIENEDTDSEIGCFYQLGNHTLLCSEKLDTRRLASFGKCDMFIGYIPEWSNENAIMLSNASMCLRDGGVFYCIHEDADTLNVRMQLRGCGLGIHEILVWIKSFYNIIPNSNYQTHHAVIAYGWKDGKPHRWFSDRKQTNLFSYDNAEHGGAPVKMYVYAIRNSTERGNIVFDNFTNNGTSVIACEQTGRVCRCVVNDKNEADLIRKRWAEFVYGKGCDWRKVTPKC